jgi:hypothetical protein
VELLVYLLRLEAAAADSTAAVIVESMDCWAAAAAVICLCFVWEVAAAAEMGGLLAAAVAVDFDLTFPGKGHDNVYSERVEA